MFLIYEACLSHQAQDVQERLERKKKKLDQAIEIISGAATLNQIVELLTDWTVKQDIQDPMISKCCGVLQISITQ
jgi:hypothetical protein